MTANKNNVRRLDQLTLAAIDDIIIKVNKLAEEKGDKFRITFIEASFILAYKYFKAPADYKISYEKIKDIIIRREIDKRCNGWTQLRT